MPTQRSTPRPKPTIAELITAYLAETADDPAARARDDGGPEVSLDLLRSALNGYGYQYLGRADAELVQAAYDDGDEEAFCRMAGAAVLLKYLDEFLGDFLVRKVRRVAGGAGTGPEGRNCLRARDRPR